ncbi:unnamed protein product, partial [Staurois parvus]
MIPYCPGAPRVVSLPLAVEMFSATHQCCPSAVPISAHQCHLCV